MRIQSGKSRAAVATDCAVYRQTIINMETEKCIPSNETLTKFLDSVDTSLDNQPQLKFEIVDARKKKIPVVRETFELSAEVVDESLEDQLADRIVAYLVSIAPDQEEYKESHKIWAKRDIRQVLHATS